MSNIKTLTQNRWPGIFSSLGISVGTGKHCVCPIHGAAPHGHSFRFDDKEGNGTWICSQCGAGNGISLVMKVLNVDFKQACQEIEKIIGNVKPMKHQPETQMTAEKMREIFLTSHKIRKDDAVYKYLTKRGLSEYPHVLRCTSKCWEPETKKEQRAMLAIFSLPNSEAVTMHRTFIDNEGNKLKIDSPKKMLPTLKPMAGGAVRLFEHGEQLGIAEGIETALSVHELYKIPCWAALSAQLLESFKPPVNIKELTILQYIQCISIVFIGIVMFLLSYKLLSMRRFERMKARKLIGSHYMINFMIVPIMLMSVNPWAGILVFLPALGFIFSNIILHGTFLQPKTM